MYDAALLPAGLIAAFCVRALLAGRAALRARLGELAVYVVMSAGLMVLIGADSYRSFPEVNAEYGQARYLLPLLPLLGAVLALAARGAGRRWGPVLGAGIVVLFLGHDIFSQLQVVARYYRLAKASQHCGPSDPPTGQRHDRLTTCHTTDRAEDVACPQRHL